MEPRSASQQPKTRHRPAPRGTGAYQRKRAVTACQVCRARRTKCDNLKPSCSFCLKVGATCIQSEVGLSNFDPASIKILERLEILEALMRQNPQSAQQSQHQVQGVPSPTPTDSYQSHVDSSSSATPPGRGPGSSLSSLLQPSTLDQIMTWPCFQGVFAGSELKDQSCIPSPAQSCHTGSLLPTAALTAIELEPVRVRRLVDQFFRNVHIKNPIFDERSMRQVVDLTTVNGLDWSPQSCLSLFICAVGAVATPFEPGNYYLARDHPTNSQAFSYFLAAEKRLGPLIASYDITAAQCLFLAGVFMMYVFEPVRAWRFFLQALAHCQQMKLHSPVAQRRHHEWTAEEIESDPQAEFVSSHQVLYWSIWKSERDMRRYLDMPDFGTGDGHISSLYPMFLPTPPPPRTYGDESLPLGESPEQGHYDDQSEQTAWYFYLAEISLRRLNTRLEAELKTLQQRHAASTKDFLAAAAAIVPLYEAQIHNWIDSLPSNLSFSEPMEQDDACRFSLRGIMIGTRERLYWPFVMAFLSGHGRYAAQPTSSQTYVELAQKGLDLQQRKLAINRPGFRYRHQGTFSMVHACARSALVLIAASLQEDHALEMPVGWQRDVKDVVEMLEFWTREAPVFERSRDILQVASIWAIGDSETQTV